MPIRNTHRVGDYLMQDDLTGLVYYRSEMVQLWDGLWTHVGNYETRNPQEFVHALRDPRALKEIRPDVAVTAVANFVTNEVGQTTVSSILTGPAVHLFKPGIGQMIIEGANLFTVFEVDPDS